MAGKQQIVSDSIEKKPIHSTRPNLGYTLFREKPVLAGHKVSWTIGLGDNFVGFHIPLRSNYDLGSDREDEILELLSGLVNAGYKYVPVGALTELKDSVAHSLIRGAPEDHLRLDKFYAAIPLHEACKGCRSFYLWDSKFKDWRLRFPRNVHGLNVPGSNVLLIAYNPYRCTCYKELDEAVWDEGGIFA